MIESFGSRLAEDLFDDKQSTATRRFPAELHRAARRKLLYLYDAVELNDLRSPPGNRLERLKGDLRDYHSVRINDQWRVIFRWEGGAAHDVKILDDHK